ncbi:MAG: Spy/CpxP family protein refolding chaperone [Pseudobdellovibrio sp.]
MITFKPKHFIVMSSLIIFSALHSYADSDCMDMGKDKFNYMKKIKKELNLTAEQKKQLKDSGGYSREDMKQKHTALREAQKSLEETLKSDASEEQIRAKFTELQTIQEDFAKARFEKILKIRSVLTPEQRAKFKNVIGKK